jgi:hypothetical protein
MTGKTSMRPSRAGVLPAGYAGIHGDIVELLDSARRSAARRVNALMTASTGRSANGSSTPSRKAGDGPATGNS